MNARFIVVFLFLLLGLAGTAAEPPSPTPRRVLFVDADDPALAEIRSIGERAIDWVAGRMINEASSSIAAHSGADAVAICHLKRLPVTGDLIPALPRVTAIKRTSLRLRNPANAPDAPERLVLERIRQDLAAGLPAPPLLLQCIDNSDATKEWRVYRPVSVTRQCASCHGPAQSHSSELRAILQESYPSDTAVDYSIGEWRGIVRVTVSDMPRAKASTFRETAEREIRSGNGR